MGRRLYLAISATIFGIVAILHLLRVSLGREVRIGSYEIPMAVSWGGGIAGLLLCLWGFRLARGKREKKSG